MKLNLLLLAAIVAIILVPTVSAVTLDKGWTAASGCWTATAPDGSYLIMWNATGTSTWDPPEGINITQYLVLAGAGGGGKALGGGGGGAGGLFIGGGLSIIGKQTIIVGTGGAASTTTNVPGISGTNSSFGNITVNKTSIGGSGGGSRNNTPTKAMSYMGASTGGGGSPSSAGQTVANISNQEGYGRRGGTGIYNTSSSYSGGGGGSYLANGSNSVSTNVKAGNGGLAINVTITGENITLAGGGGGGTYSSTSTNRGLGGANGTTVGGSGAYRTTAATAAVKSTGSGGGGGGSTGVGSAGSAGIVIIRFNATPVPVASFTTNTTSGYYAQGINFNSTSLYSPTTWNWSFGDTTWDNTSGRNVSHTYSSNGTYNAFLIASNLIGTNRSTNTTITIASIKAQFTTNATQIEANGTILLTSTTLGTATEYNWSLGDGTWSNGSATTTKRYPNCGIYLVNLTVKASDGITNKSTTSTITVGASNIISLLHFNGTMGSQTITDENTSKTWGIYGVNGSIYINTTTPKFGSGSLSANSSSPFSLTIQLNTSNSDNSINTAESFTVDFWYKSPPLGDEVGAIYFSLSNSSTESFYIQSAYFGGLVSNFATGFWCGGSNGGYYATPYNTTFFNDQWHHVAVIWNATNSSDYIWVDGLGQGSALVLTPIEIAEFIKCNKSTADSKMTILSNMRYGSPPQSQLTIVNESVDEFRIRKGIIYTPGVNFAPPTQETVITSCAAQGGSTLPIVSFSLDKKQFTFTRPVTCTDSSVNATSWLWRFGDGTTSTAQNPTHKYNRTGTFLINLTATNTEGSNTSANQKEVIMGEEVYQ